ncbi:MAG: Ig-like domain-containing protein [Spirochaetes bacterium]|nr:Ig-like domain-containing protein [Spirochaetota bacterium]
MGETMTTLRHLALVVAAVLALSVPARAAVSIPAEYLPDASVWISGVVSNATNVDAGVGRFISNVVITTNGSFATNFTGPCARLLDWFLVVDTATWADGTNLIAVFATNTNNQTDSNTFFRLVDNSGPRHAATTPSGWVSSNTNLRGSILRTNSIMAGPVVVRIGTNQANAVEYLVTNWTTNGASNLYTLAFPTTNLPNGTNTVWVTVTNGATPGVASTTNYPLLVDNGSLALNVAAPGAWQSGTASFTGQILCSNAGILTNLLARVGTNLFPATAVDAGGGSTNYTVQFAIDTTALSNGSNTLVVAVTNGSTPAVVLTNTYLFLVDNGAPKISTTLSPSAWLSSNFMLTGTLALTNSGVTGKLLVIIQGSTNVVALTSTASNFEWIMGVGTNGLLDGSNLVQMIASNGAVPPITATSNFTLLFDGRAPELSATVATNWVSGTNVIAGVVARTNSGLGGPILLQVGTNVYRVFPSQTNAASYVFSTNLQTSNFLDGTNAVTIIMTNGANPPILATSNFSLWVDNRPPGISSSLAAGLWRSSNVVYAGNIRAPASGLPAAVKLTLGALVTNVAVTPTDAFLTNGAFSVDFPTNYFTNGSNPVGVEATNNAAPGVWAATNEAVLMDRQAALPAALSPTNWSQGNAVTLSAMLTNRHSGVAAVALRVGGQAWAATVVTNGASNLTFSVTVDTTGAAFTNGTNAVVVEVTNGATPPVVASNAFPLLVDNQYPAPATNLDVAPTAWLMGATNLSGTLVPSASGLAGIRVQVGTNQYTVGLATNASNLVWSVSLPTTALSNGPTNLVVWASNASALLTNQSYALQIDNFRPVPTNAIAPAGWLGAVQVLSGSVLQPYSSLSFLGLTLGGQALTNGVVIATNAGSVTYQATVNTSNWANGTNLLVVVASNASGPGLGTNQAYPVRIDNDPPQFPAAFAPTNWVRGAALSVTGTVVESNARVSSVSFSYIDGAGLPASAAAAVTTNAVTNGWTLTIDTTTLSNGSVPLDAVASNEVSPVGTGARRFTLLVDNEAPVVQACAVRNVSQTNAWFDLVSDDFARSGVVQYVLSNLSNASMFTNVTVSNATPLSNVFSFNLVRPFSNSLQAWTVRARDALSNVSAPVTNLFEYDIVSNAGPIVTNGVVAQNAAVTLYFKEPIAPAAIFDTRNFYVSAVPGNYTTQLIPTAAALSADQLSVTLTPLSDLGQGVTRYFNLSTNVATVAGARPISNRAYPFTTLGPMSVSNSSVAGSLLGIKPTIRITFSLDVVPATVNEQSLHFYRNDQATNQLHYTIVPLAGTPTYQLSLDEPLAPLTNYTLVIDTNIQATNGARLTNNAVWAFTTSDSFKYSTLTPQFFNVPLNVRPSIKFLTNILAASITNPSPQLTLSATASNGTLTPVTGNVVLTNNDTVLFIPATNLVVNTTYVVTVYGSIMSVGSNLFGQILSWEFTTGDPVAPPYATVPAAGAAGVRLGTAVSAAFTNTLTLDSASVSVDSFYLFTYVDTNGNPVKVPATTVVKDYSNLLLTPAVPLDPSRAYQAVITTKLRWSDGNGLDSNRSWTFTTAAALGAPTALVPASGATFVEPSTPVNATFAEDLRIDTVTASSFGVVDADTGDPVSGTVNYLNRRISFLPKDPLKVGKKYTATIQKGILSANDTPLSQAVSWTFSIGAFVGPAGGKVSTPDGAFTLFFPPRALERDTLIQITPKEPDGSEQSTAPGAVFPAGTSFEIGPSETPYLKPVAATFNFAQTPAAGMKDLAIYRWNSGQWTLVGGSRDGTEIAFTLRSPGRYSLVQGGSGSAEGAGISCYPRVATLAEGMHISFSLALPKNGRIRIYHVGGAPIRELTGSRGLNAGDNTFFWNCKADDGRAVAPGVYIIVVEDAGFKRVLEKIVSVVRS